MAKAENTDSYHQAKEEPELVLLTIPEQIAVRLARDIFEGRFDVNEKLSEPKLAVRFGVSRGPIRDAIQILEHNAFVRCRPRRSAQVNSTSRYEVEQLFDVRALLLGLVARYAARNASSEDVAGIAEAIAGLEWQCREKPGDVGGFFSENGRIWRHVHSAARARRVSTISSYVVGSAIWQLVFREKLDSLIGDLPGLEMINTWKRFASAVKNRDEESAEVEGRNIIHITWSMIATVFPQDAPDQDWL